MEVLRFDNRTLNALPIDPELCTEEQVACVPNTSWRMRLREECVLSWPPPAQAFLARTDVTPRLTHGPYWRDICPLV